VELFVCRFGKNPAMGLIQVTLKPDIFMWMHSTARHGMAQYFEVACLSKISIKHRPGKFRQNYWLHILLEQLKTLFKLFPYHIT